MKKLMTITVLLLSLTVAFAGCDNAKKAAEGTKDAAGKAVEGVKDAAGKAIDSVKALADVDLGGFKGSELTKKLSDITTGIKDVTADNVDALKSKISGLSESLGKIQIDKLPSKAKSALASTLSKFADTLQKALEGISDEGILGKLKPAVDALLEKVKSFQ